VRDRAAKRAAHRALGIDVDPLMVIRGVSEQVDTILGDLQPIGGTQLRALRRNELVQPAELLHHFSPCPL
jgi:hypothetical protein